MEEKNIEEKKYEKIKTSDIKRFYPKKCSSTMKRFCENKNISENNSKIKFNQLSVIDKYGVLYFFNESGIYFLDNSKMKELFEEKKDLSFSNLFFLKCKNIYKLFLIEENGKTYLIICVKKFKNEENSFLIYIDFENIIEELDKQKNIYDTKIIEDLEKKEEIFSSGLYKKELEELNKNIELNEDGIYDKNIKWEIKKLTKKEKKREFEKEKKKILEDRDKIFDKNYKNSPKYIPDKIIYIENKFLDIIILDKEKYALLLENGDIIFYKNYEKITFIEKQAKLMSYNKDTSVFLVISNDCIYIFKEKNNFNSLKEIKKLKIKNIISDTKIEKIIFSENIYNYIILYTIENSENPKNDDKLYFLEMDKKFEEIVKIYYEKEYFRPDDYEIKGISFYNHLKRTIFSFFDKNLGIYMIFNKHADLLNKYYIFLEKKEEKNIYNLFSIYIDDADKINSRWKPDDEQNKKQQMNYEEEEEEEEEENEEDKEDKEDLESNNAFIGIALIKFKFDGYDKDKEYVKGEEVNTPFLIVVLGYYGGFKIFYSSNESKELIEKGKTILIEEKGNNFDKVKNISNKVREISINEEIIELEKEKFINENMKKSKNFSELINLKKLNNRNIFLHGLDQQIKENLEYFDNLVIPERIKQELNNLKQICDNKEIKDIENSMDNLLKEAKDLFEKNEENEQFIDENKRIIEKFKMIEINFNDDINTIENNKNISKELKLSLNSPINELLSHKTIKKFFEDETISKMKKIFEKLRKNYNLYKNHSNLISELFNINQNLVEQLEECKSKYNSIKIQMKYLENRKDVRDIKENLQNNIFLLYMRVFEQYFFNLEQFKNNSLNKEYIYLEKLKNNHLKSDNQENHYEEENIYNKNNDRKERFILEEDIDEGNNNIINSNEINNISNSSQNINKINNNNEQQNIIIQSKRNIINDYNYDKNTVNEKTNETINKIFKTNLIEDREGSKKNYLLDVLSDFEGRITYYNSDIEDDYCTDADDFFKEFLEDQNEINEKKLKEKQLRESEKQDIIKSFQESIYNQNEVKKKIEEELSKIEENNKKDIIEKERENNNLKKRLEELEKIFVDNKNERENEKNKLKEQMEKTIIEENQKKLDEQKNMVLKIKDLEEQIKNLEIKLKNEENKKKEVEDKNKKLEEEYKNIIENNNKNTINININNNQNNETNTKSNLNDNNQNNLFTSNIPNKTENMFLQKQNSDIDNTTQKQTTNIFDSITGKDTNNLNSQIESNHQNDNLPKDNLFSVISSSNLKDNNIFSSNNNNPPKNIFNFDKKNENNVTQTQNQTQTQNNFLANNENINNNQSSQPSQLFSSIKIGQNQNTFTNIFKNQTNIFGQHNRIGFGQGIQSNDNKRVNPTGSLHFGSVNISNNLNNPLTFENVKNSGNSGLFGPQNQANNTNNEVYF